MLATPQGVDRAFAKLDTIKRQTVWWEKGAQPPQLLLAGEVTMAAAYNGRITAANKAETKNLRMVWTNNIYTVDSWVIMKGSPTSGLRNGFWISRAARPSRRTSPPIFPMV